MEMDGHAIMMFSNMWQCGCEALDIFSAWQSFCSKITETHWRSHQMKPRDEYR